MTSDKRKKRRKSSKKLFCFLLAVFLFWFYNNYTIKVTETEISDSRLNDEITIVQISDLHAPMEFGKNNRRLINKIKKQNPDIIVATGDMYTSHSKSRNFEKGKNDVLDLMKNLLEICPVYYVNGEHDYWVDEFFDDLRDTGVKVMKYEDEIVKIKKSEIHIYGIDNIRYSDSFDLKNAFRQDNSRYSVLLAHSSNFKKFADFGIDLTLSGDTHGGVVRLPKIGGIYDGEVLFPDFNGHYTKGLYEIGNSKLFVSSGLGAYPGPVRLFNRPEIVAIHLKGTSS